MEVDDKTRIKIPTKTDVEPAVSPDATVFSPARADRKVVPASVQPLGAIQPVESARADATVFAPAGRAAVPRPLPAIKPQTAKLDPGAAPTNPDVTVFSPPVRNASTPLAAPAATPVTSESSVTKTVIKGRFELDKLLGVGGMGAVYKALDRRKVEASDSDPYVAIKVLNDDFKAHPDAFMSLQREARKSQTLAHPSIVTVFDFDRDADMVFMTMEFLDGMPLDELLREHRDVGLGEDEAQQLLRDITQALIYAHSHGIVHSDFKPGNIFATKSKGAKVFDFGIARAVSAGGMGDVVGETTLFDAGSLGALTPAYASLEMLRGEEPAPSDDVYALGCVAYELYTGRHPFDKTPADKAVNKKLKPKRIKALSRRQWRALEQALEFSRDKRTETVEEFEQQFFGRSKAIWLGLGAAVISLSALAGAYYLSEKAEVDEAYKQELQQQLQNELQISRIADKKESLQRLLDLGSLSVDWERKIRTELASYKTLSPADSKTPELIRKGIADKFVVAAAEYLQAGELDNAEMILERAGKWQSPTAQASAVLSGVAQQRADIQAAIEAERLEAERRVEAERRAKQRAQVAAEKRARAKQLDAAITDIETAVQCGYGMDISGALASSMASLKTLDATKDRQIRPVVAQELSRCISGLAAKSPKRASPLLAQALVLLPEQGLIRDLKIDYCGHLKPGSGGRGSRYDCQDKLAGGGLGPHLVVTEGESKRPLAIGKYEVSFNDLKPYCRQSGACGDIQLMGDLPVNNIPLPVAEGYLAWLSEQTGYHYRLPTYREWFAAASARGEREQPDRNCRLKYGGIEKGAELVATEAGKGNSFGLINHVGNVQEWVRSGDQLLAAGGHRQDAMSLCVATSKKMHDGRADIYTGFRIARNLSKKQ